jgi:hypothetical protein
MLTMSAAGVLTLAYARAGRAPEAVTVATTRQTNTPAAGTEATRSSDLGR